jgi:hypothetical protein
MSLKFSKIVGITNNLFVITVILTFFVRYKHEILMINYAKPNQKLGFVRYKREFAITVIVITEFDCILFCHEKIGGKAGLKIQVKLTTGDWRPM